MADLAHVVGYDLQVTSSGDLAVVTDDAETQQRILHRLLTSVGNYIWQPAYGAGLPSLIGSIVSRQQIIAIISAQIKNEPSVAAIPEPKVDIVSSGIATTATTITYKDLKSRNMQVLNLPAGA